MNIIGNIVKIKRDAKIYAGTKAGNINIPKDSIGIIVTGGEFQAFWWKIEREQIYPPMHIPIKLLDIYIEEQRLIIQVDRDYYEDTGMKAEDYFRQKNPFDSIAFPMIKSNLKTLNSRPEATHCAYCNTLLKEPMPGIKYCPDCEG